MTDLGIREAPFDQLERHRVELTGYCYRMLGCPYEAEDAVQEIYLRAWRSLDRYDRRRASWRTWLYSIATNVCIDMLRGSRRRARAMDLGPPADGGPDFSRRPLSADHWVQPVSDSLVLPGTADPVATVEMRESIRLAFVAALQWLPPRQRAILILRDVLSWSAREVAGLLDSSVAGVNSALQRARATLEVRQADRPEVFAPADRTQQQLLEDYVAAFESHDIARLVTLLHEDAINSMPPFQWWIRGREKIASIMQMGDGCRGDRLVPTVANGSPAFGQYKVIDGRHRPFGLVTLEIVDHRIIRSTTFLDGERIFPRFGLPPSLAS